ncbi:PIN-FORMED 5 [Hibiscus trionum]|uniref:Auxin efflux carrier component n=1 Tax=Hibiscus trionum TaxID=183268 RepID=A0A9W7HLD1_HIBTR|nr:PIN-FORMED 5 [Hibiscus trionum]
MIGWEEVYKVVAAMVPLYVALTLGYGSVKWWRVFTPEECDAINRLVCYFTLPLFAMEFTSHIDPFEMNYRFIGADVISHVVIVVVLAFWAKFSSRGSYSWSITSFSLSTLTNTLVVGVPLMKAMYGKIGVDLVIQSFAIQSIIWITFFLAVLEFRRLGASVAATNDDKHDKDVEMNTNGDGGVSNRPSFWHLMKVVGVKVTMNPNVYACVIGLVWAFVSKRWHFEMPSFIDGSILIMSHAGAGTAMFSMGMFMAVQEKIISCGIRLTIFGMILKFIAGPAAMTIGAIVVGLHGDVLRVVIIQAAMPQSIASFIFAKDYGIHAEVVSTAVIFGTIVSLPVLIAYYVILEFVN